MKKLFYSLLITFLIILQNSPALLSDPICDIKMGEGSPELQLALSDSLYNLNNYIIGYLSPVKTLKVNF